MPHSSFFFFYQSRKGIWITDNTWTVQEATSSWNYTDNTRLREERRSTCSEVIMIHSWHRGSQHLSALRSVTAEIKDIIKHVKAFYLPFFLRGNALKLSYCVFFLFFVFSQPSSMALWMTTLVRLSVDRSKGFCTDIHEQNWLINDFQVKFSICPKVSDQIPVN